MSTPSRARVGTVLFDADSTLSAIEGIDWLAALRGPDMAREIAVLTDCAMNGLVPLDDVYAERIARIRPTRAELDALAHAYIERIVPGTAALFAALHRAGVTVHVISGGLRDALLPLAAHLGVAPEQVHAVSLRSPRGDDVLDAIDGDQPLSTQGGKPVIVQRLLYANTMKRPIAFVGDGSTDAAAQPLVDRFIAFTGVVRRPGVVAVADAEARSMAELTALLIHAAP